MLNKSPYLYGEWAMDPLYEKAVKLWIEYYDQCEAFDETKCHWRGLEGFALPVTRVERSVCTAFSTRCYKDLMWQAKEENIPKETMQAASYVGLHEHERKWKRGEPYSVI